MFSILWWLVIGLCAGGVARLLVPGRQSMSLFMTMVLGLIGSLLGGGLSALLFGYDPMAPGIHAGGLVMSTVGAVIALVAYLRWSASRALPQDGPRL